METIPTLWAEPHGHLHRDRLRREASGYACRHAVPLAPDALRERLARLREKLWTMLALDQPEHPPDIEEHGSVACDGYAVHRISFASGPGIRVTGNLYRPDGNGPFPAVLNLHGHWSQGKLAAQVQARGHVLARSGFVVLTVDAAGSGERSDAEREWSYHGAAKAAELLLSGDSLLALQVRDNRRALDVLQSLPGVDPERIGATGASGGGNQTMWLSALDERVKAAVPVVSVGSFAAYVGARNCMCETLPGGLNLAEEWEVLGLIAPRPLLIVNALHDQPAFGYEALSATCRNLQEVYLMQHARNRLDWRILDMEHGYHPPVLHLMRDWMAHWLKNEPASPEGLPDWNPIAEAELLCYPPGRRPDACGYRAVRETLHLRRSRRTAAAPDAARTVIAELTGWQGLGSGGAWTLRRTLPDGTMIGAVTSPRGLPLPAAFRPDPASTGTRLILSPEGKRSPFAATAWREAPKPCAVLAADLPGTGELAWETTDVAGTRLHDTSRACLWLGYTLAAEWAEAIAALVHAARSLNPGGAVSVVADRECAFAALLCQVLLPEMPFTLQASGLPSSLRDPANDSLAWCVPGLLQWGDIDDLQRLAQAEIPPQT